MSLFECTAHLIPVFLCVSVLSSFLHQPSWSSPKLYYVMAGSPTEFVWSEGKASGSIKEPWMKNQGNSYQWLKSLHAVLDLANSLFSSFLVVNLFNYLNLETDDNRFSECLTEVIFIIPVSIMGCSFGTFHYCPAHSL